MEEDNRGNSFQSVQHILDDVSSVKVKAEGEWNSLSATLVITIYYGV